MYVYEVVGAVDLYIHFSFLVIPQFVSLGDNIIDEIVG
jgi:hypothetical protein